MKFVKEKLIENIRELLKLRGIKIGDLEQQIGVSPGYFSRILKEGRDVPVEHIIAVAEVLQVSIDSLLFGDFGSRYNGEKRICEYLDKIIIQSKNGKIKWNKGLADKFVERESDISRVLERFQLEFYKNSGEYFRGRGQDNREFLLLYMEKEKGAFGGWWLGTIGWAKIPRDSNEDYELDPYFIDICLPIVYCVKEVVKAKIQELLECIENCMNDISVSVETMMEIDAFLSE